jgi:hypothetical protein
MSSRLREVKVKANLITFLATVGIMVCLSSCNTSCNADPQEFILLTRSPIVDNTVFAPSTVEFSTPVEYTIPSGGGGLFSCPKFTPVQVQRVTFYNNGANLGTVSIAPFILTRSLVPGKDGVPATGSGQLHLYAIDSNGTRTVRDLTLTVAVK